MNKDDVKVVIMPTSDTAVVTAVTVGIGNDTAAEKKLRDWLPQTKFHGADPIAEDGAVFKSLGDYHQIAVNDKPGRAMHWQSLVPVHCVVGEVGFGLPRSIQRQRSPRPEVRLGVRGGHAITIREFLHTRLSLPLVDFLFLDIEGAEYRILPQSIKGNLTEEGICQVNLEVHGPVANYSTTYSHFNALVKRLISETYLPLWIPRPLYHHRFFLACVRKYFTHWC